MVGRYKGRAKIGARLSMGMDACGTRSGKKRKFPSDYFFFSVK